MDGSAHHRADADGASLDLTAAAGADWTNDAAGGEQQHHATSLSFEACGDFTLSARVTVDDSRNGS